MISLQPVIVPVGRISLGRIINVVGSSIDSYVDMALSSQYQCSASYNTILCVSSCADTSYPLSYPKHTIEIGSINIYPSLDYFNHISLCLGNAWCIYIAYFYVALQMNNWILFLSTIAAPRIKFVNFNVTVASSELIKLLVLLLYNSDTLYSFIKPIHKTPLAIIELSVSIRLFETGIKVVDLMHYTLGGIWISGFVY